MVKEFIGKIIKFNDLEQGESNGRKWQKLEVVIATEDEYNPELCITAFGEKSVRSLSALDVGMVAGILCNVYSKEWKGRYYTHISGYHFTNQTNNPDKNKEVASGFVTSSADDNNPF
tara:strand:- start:3003 stop:3353 length:351 start_codon:yes stop_codon:yes gene_type:complete